MVVTSTVSLFWVTPESNPGRNNDRWMVFSAAHPAYLRAL
jgi:hypothetical protein